MTLSDYFKRSDTPMQDSPTGRLMETILRDDPSLTFDRARQLAIDCLAKAANRDTYRIVTPKRAALSIAKFKKRLARVDPTLEMGKSGHPGECLPAFAQGASNDVSTRA